MHMKIKTLLGLVGFAAFVGGLVVSGRLSTTQVSGAATRDQPTAQARPMAATAGLPDLSPIAERALKVSANISSTTTSRITDPRQRFLFGDMAQQSQSLGSGVVVSADGYVLTNTHVIGSTSAEIRSAEIRVTLSDGRERVGKLIGIDDVTDLAVVKVDGQNLPTLPWADSDQLRVAEWVLAIGNPFQLSGTVTLGIISTVSRSGAQVGAFKDLIQTDAAINPGNSGGALVSARGELVGINSMIYTETGGYQGIGFAIPSNLAQKIMAELIKNGYVPWGDIGQVIWMNIDRATAQYNGLGDVAGVYVRNLAMSSSAAAAGLRRGDIVVAIAGQKVTEFDQLNRLIVAAKPGERVKFDVVRNGQRVTIDVPIVSRQQPSGR